MKTARTSVFISYSHVDSHWREMLTIHLHPLVRDQQVQIWSDRDIHKGERWQDRIRRQLAQAKVAIFLVSADFLASDFIHAEELPPLLVAAEQEGAILLSIIVRPCAFRDSPLSSLQAMNSPSQPLSGMSKTQRERVMLSVYEELREVFKPQHCPAEPAVPPPVVTQPKVKTTETTLPKTGAKPLPKSDPEPGEKPPGKKPSDRPTTRRTKNK
ncbi:toll/interleukin-1 receptor domain-containing protein [Hymenobacter cellulosivorans]|uniref:Toll/interleukin-1 receptor domain-containing protein n=1 Tax=Hymenobacter cellulosivorans TaxID=2932249 RepID=A0ABY4FCF4_9BACT|nr:toll/interleukin-1 receptor domain-containing protein [Hymenobacter cellulosivorans]UOQ54338.1 toll/interleukin-1 receptor domain-containing protein [Hymenobacter cellulosivorans]